MVLDKIKSSLLFYLVQVQFNVYGFLLCFYQNEPHQKESDYCLTLEELLSLVRFEKELQNLGQFELVSL